MASNMLIFLLLMFVSFNSEAVRIPKIPKSQFEQMLKIVAPNSDKLNVRRNSETKIPILKLNSGIDKVPRFNSGTEKFPRLHSVHYKISNPTINSVAYNFPSNSWTSSYPKILDHLKTRQPTPQYLPSTFLDYVNNARTVLLKQQQTESDPSKTSPSNLEILENVESAEQTPIKSIREKALLKLSIFYDTALESAKRFNSIAKREWFKQRTKSVPSKTMPSNPEILENLKSSESTPPKYSKTSDSEYALNSPRKESLKQQRTKSESAIEFEKQVDEYAKIQNKIKELKEQIDFLEELIAKNGHYEAIYEKIIKDYMDKKRSQLLCVMEKQNWHQARLGKLRSCRKKNAAQCCLNTQEMKADKFCPEVMAAYHEREFLEQLKEWHKRNFFIGDQFTKK